MAKTEQPIAGISIVAAAALAKNRFATVGGAVPAAGAYCPGVTSYSVESGDDGYLVTHGIVLVESGAAVTANAAVQTDNQGRAIDLDAGVALGRALTAATTSGQLVWVKI